MARLAGAGTPDLLPSDRNEETHAWVTQACRVCDASPGAPTRRARRRQRALALELELFRERVDDAGSNCVPAHARAPRARPSALSAAAVDAVGRHRVVGVDDEDDSRAERDLGAGEPVRIAVRRPSARGGAGSTRRPARCRGSRASGTRSADAARARAAPASVSGPGLRRISSGIASLPRSCRLPASRVSSICSSSSAEAAATRAASSATRAEWLPVYVSRSVDRLRQARGRAEARGAVRAVAPAAGARRARRRRAGRRADPVLAVLLRPVERAVGETDQLVAAGACAGNVATPALTVTEPMCSSVELARRARRSRAAAAPPPLVVPGRRTANSSPPSRNASPSWRRRAASWASTRSPAGWPKRSLTRLKSSTSTRQRLSDVPSLLRLDQLALEPLVEVPVVAEPRQRIGQRELHRAQCAVGRALVERDREQRADERRGQQRRALPEDDQHRARPKPSARRR